MNALISHQMIQFVLHLSSYFQVFHRKVHVFITVQLKVLGFLYIPLLWQVLFFFLMIMSFKVLNQYIFLYVSNKDNFACPV